MIVVGNFNSTLDKYCEADEIRAGGITRLTSVTAYAGGKGVHAAQACALLGEAVRVVGVIDERHAAMFEDALGKRAVEWRGVAIGSPIRSCYVIRDGGGTITEIREPGPLLGAADVQRLEDAFIEACSGADVAVLSGSLPLGCPPDLYARIVSRLNRMQVPTVVDSSGPPLARAIEAAPSIVKSNAEEAGGLTGLPISDVQTAVAAARALAARGIQRVIISLGGAGALAAWDGRCARLEVPVQAGVSAVGSGDCFTGALAVGLVRRQELDDMLRVAAGCGAANVLSSEPGFFDPADARRLAGTVTVSWL